MWEYLVTDPEKQKLEKMHGGGGILLYRTEEVVNRIIKWHILCALDPDCIAPRGASASCNFQGSNKLTKRKGSCHRFDMCAVHTLLANE
jgi:hypothetical protein